MNSTLFDQWKDLCHGPYCFSATRQQWEESMFRDVDSDGRTLFDQLHILQTSHGFAQFGTTAFGFDENGELSQQIHHNVIRMLYFDPEYPGEGQQLLHEAMGALGAQRPVFAFFHYFGMSICARHGKLHQSYRHVETLLLNAGFTVEHENVYYSKELTGEAPDVPSVRLLWKPLSPGGCREFAAVVQGQEIGWGQVHFLPQSQIAYLRWIYIDQSQQHKGYGTIVLQGLFFHLYQMGIHRFDTDTALQNTVAQAYYEKNGFTNRGITRSYFLK